MQRLRAILLITAIACGGNEGSPDIQRLATLRVSVHTGLAPVTPWVSNTGSANLLYLQFTRGDLCFSSMRKSEAGWLLRRRSDCPYSSEQLAAALRHPSLISASPTADGVLALLSSPPVEVLEFTYDLGPFVVESYTPNLLTFKRRSGQGADRIQVIAMSSEDEEWHRFLARDVDVVTTGFPRQLAQLADVPTARIVDVEDPSTVSIYFHVSAGVFADPRLRDAVSLGLRRRAIASIATNDARDALDAEEDFDAAQRVVGTLAPGRPITLLSHAGSSDQQQAVLVLEQQLLELGFDVTVKALEADALVAFVQTKPWDIVFFLGGTKARYHGRFVSSPEPNLWGYSNPDFDSAVAAGDTAAATKILEKDRPVVPIYRVREGIAIDSRFCGAHPKVGWDLSWLADIHLCVPGERE